MTYQYAKSIIDSAKIDEHVSSKEDFDLKTDEVNRLHKSAQAMMIAIKSIAKEKIRQ